MKINVLVFVLFSLFYSCYGQNTSQLSPQEQETIKVELHNSVEKILRNLEKGDVDLALEPYVHSDDFTAVGLDGSIVGYQSLKTDNEDFINSFQSLKFTTVTEDFNFLTNEIVLYLWSGKLEMISDKGEKSNFDKETVTIIFKKIDKRWKAIFQHESALPPILEKADQTKMKK